MDLFWAMLITIPIAFLIAIQVPSTLKYHIKYAVLHLLFLALAAFSGPFCIFRPGSSKNIIFPKFVLKLLSIEWWMGMKVVVKDWDRMKQCSLPCVIVSNHQTSIDAMIIIKTAPVGAAPLAKQVLKYVPIFGQVCWLCGTIFINRKKGRSAIDTMRRVGKEMKKRMTSLWIFPEGTRIQSDSIAPFKKGAFHLAIQAQVPIVPVVISNYRNVIDRKNRLFSGGEIRVNCLEPISTLGMTNDDVIDMMDSCREEMLKVYERDFEENKLLYAGLTPVSNKNE